MQVSSPRLSLLPSSSLPRLTTPSTLKTTLQLSSQESYWHLTHSPCTRRTLSTGAMLETFTLDIPSGQTMTVTAKNKPIPSEFDYQKVQKRLEAVISGEDTDQKPQNATEDKHIRMLMLPREWRFVRIKTYRKRIPLSISIVRTKGKILSYVNKSQKEPTEQEYDGLFPCDFFEIFDSYSEFHFPMLTLGLKCIHEAEFTLSIHFGTEITQSNPRFPRAKTVINPFGTPEALNSKVNEILSNREAQISAFPIQKNHIQKNILQICKTVEDIEKRRNEEKCRRQMALVKYKEKLQEKRNKVENAKKEKQMRIEAAILAKKLEEEEIERKENLRFMLNFAYFTSISQSLFDRFYKRKTVLEQAKKVTFAVILIQRCYRRIFLSINPKRCMMERSLHHISLLTSISGPKIAYLSRKKLMKVIRDSCTVDTVNAGVRRVMRKMRLIQKVWREYLARKQERLERLSRIWDTALRALSENKKIGKGKKSKNAKMSGVEYNEIDRYPVLLEYLQTCKQRFYAHLRTVYNSKLCKLAAETVQILKNDREISTFHYLMTIEEMKALIQSHAK